MLNAIKITSMMALATGSGLVVARHTRTVESRLVERRPTKVAASFNLGDSSALPDNDPRLVRPTFAIHRINLQRSSGLGLAVVSGFLDTTAISYGDTEKILPTAVNARVRVFAKCGEREHHPMPNVSGEARALFRGALEPNEIWAAFGWEPVDLLSVNAHGLGDLLDPNNHKLGAEHLTALGKDAMLQIKPNGLVASAFFMPKANCFYVTEVTGHASFHDPTGHRIPEYYKELLLKQQIEYVPTNSNGRGF